MIRPCYYFFQKGHCYKGDACNFSHSRDDAGAAMGGGSAVGERAVICQDFQRGECFRGDTCWYSHIIGDREGGASVLDEIVSRVGGGSASLSPSTTATSSSTLIDDVLCFLDVVRLSDQYKAGFLELGLDDAKLRDICKDKGCMDTCLSEQVGVKDESHKDLLSAMLHNLNNKSCMHLCVEKWENEHKVGQYVCIQCYKYFNYDDGKAVGSNHCDNLRDATRDARERELDAGITPDAIPSDLSEEGRRDFVGKLSQGRGVTIGWLVDFTERNDCWDMSTQDVCKRFVYPATAARRCRYVELDQMHGIVGPASTFISHCRGGSWGDLVAAVCDGDADRSRRVWIDIFACRQWPSCSPDLEFEYTMKNCSSCVVVCSYLPEIERLSRSDIQSRNSEALPRHVRSKIAFLRVWCLMEVYTASLCEGMPIIMKGGSHRRVDGSIAFQTNKRMLSTMTDLIDIANADATIDQDKQMILDKIRGGGALGDGIGKLNSKIRSILWTSHNLAKDINVCVIQNAACGDSSHLALVKSDPSKYFECICAGGFMIFKELLCECLRKEESTPSFNLNDALFKACDGGHHDIAKLLIEHKADVNYRKGDLSPLSEACRGGHVETVRLLLCNGADVNIKDEKGETALIQACKWGYGDIVRLLIDYHAEINAKDNKGWSALSFSCYRGHINMVGLLFDMGLGAKSGFDINAKDDIIGLSPLCFAVQHAKSQGHFDVIRYLIKKGADVHTTEISGWNLLAIASYNRHSCRIELINHLIEEGADIDAINNKGHAPIHHVSFWGYTDVLKILIDNKANINAKDHRGMTPLMWSYGETAQLLIKAGADVNAVDNSGRSAFDYYTNNTPADIRHYLSEPYNNTTEGKDIGYGVMHGINIGIQGNKYVFI